MKAMQRQLKGTGRRGVTLTELLVVLAIISLLATMAVPVAMNRRLAAQYAVARAECEELAKAETMCGLVHGFYVPLQVLDDIPDIDPGSGPDIEDDSIDREPVTHNLIFTDVNVDDQSTGQATSGSTDPRVERALLNWQGPFAQFQRVFISSTANPSSPSPSDILRDFPLDPWGNPYRLYSPIGITGSSSGATGTNPPDESTIDSDNFSDGSLGNIDDRFDRFAVVSFGPDGVSTMNTTSGGGVGLPQFGDDVFYEFGTIVPRVNIGGGSTSKTLTTRRPPARRR